MNMLKETVNELLRKVGLKAEEIKLETQMLADGVTTIEAEVFEPGQPVFVVTEEATIALPIGEYTLQDGREITVAEEGIIASIEAPGEEEAEAPEAAPMAEPEMEMAEPQAPAAKKVIESIIKETQFAKVEEQAAEIEALKARIAELEAQKPVVEMSSDEPAAEPITYNPENEQKVELFRYGKKAGQDTLSRVMSKINN